jgi:UDP-N-acetylmuramate--alanine ligase
VLNIEQDHLDYYHDEQDILDAFVEFINGLRHGGTLVANGQDANVARILEQCRPDITCITFGFRADCGLCARNLSLVNGTFAFDIIYDGRPLGRTHISLAGRHNVLNALAVCAMATQVGLPVPLILEGLPAFLGTERRLTDKGTFDGVTVLDDYAHHPTEIRATLEAIRQRYRPGRLWCVFQPHQYSRTRFLLDDFAESFKLADVTVVPEIYFVRDSLESKQAVNAQMLVERLQDHGCYAAFIEDFTAICDYLETHTAPGDVVVTMGAGDVWKVADEYIQRIRPDC